MNMEIDVRLAVLVVMLGAWNAMNAIAQDAPPVAAFFLGNGKLSENGIEAGTPLPDGTEIKVYWDWDENGPDMKDPQPIVGDQVGQVNFNVFKINSADLGAEKGQFLSDPMFTVVGEMPKPAKYYLKICLPDRQLVSNVVTLTPGLADYEFAKWTVDKTPCPSKK